MQKTSQTVRSSDISALLRVVPDKGKRKRELMTVHQRSRRGSTFIITLWIVAALAAMALILGRTVRVEALASANRLSAAQAEATARGAEQFVLAAVDQEIATPGSTKSLSMEAIPLGSNYFWIIKPDPDDETAISFGLTDEASKLDLNTCTTGMIQNLPNITEDNYDPILDWRSAVAAPRTNGAQDSYYMSLATPYHCKNAPFETVEELLLVKNIDATLLWGNDLTRSGHVEASAAAGTLTIGANTSNRGIFPFVTVYGVKAATAPSGSAAAAITNVNTASPGAIRTLASTYATSVNADSLITATFTNRPFRNIWDWAVKTNLSSANFSKLYKHVTTTPASTAARINLNTASAYVLYCLPGLAQSDASAIVAHRQSNPAPADPTDITWMLDVVPRNKLAAIGNYITGSSHCFSADILASSGDGRSFKRTRIVVDGSVSPSRIIYRRDMTSYGWPLSADVRAQLRAGKYVPPAPSTTGAS